jgi:hypothetical protein
MKNSIIIFFFLAFIAMPVACKKGSDSKDYSQSIKGRAWWGTLTYSGKNPEYYTIHFNTDNSFLWSQMTDYYTGKYVLNGRQLTLTFDASGAEIKAQISADDKLLDITITRVITM